MNVQLQGQRVKEQVDWFSTMSSLLTSHLRDVVGQIPGLITDKTMILSCWRFTHDVCVSLLALVTHTAMRKYTRLTLFTEVHYIRCQATRRSWEWVKKNVVFKRIAKNNLKYSCQSLQDMPYFKTHLCSFFPISWKWKAGVRLGILLLILQSFDWLAAFHLELLQAIFFIAVSLSAAVFLATCYKYCSRGLPTAFFPDNAPWRMFTTHSLRLIVCPVHEWRTFF